LHASVVGVVGEGGAYGVEVGGLPCSGMVASTARPGPLSARGASLDTVRPGGLLLALYHDLDDDHREHMTSQGVEPADHVGADHLAPQLGDAFTVEVHAVEPRIDPPPDTPHIADVILRARRR
jgi:hypothetical protein